jgi:hypothetical protein
VVEQRGGVLEQVYDAPVVVPHFQLDRAHHRPGPRRHLERQLVGRHLFTVPPAGEVLGPLARRRGQ